jgi:arylsulfatase A-like enzyme/Flp pilus assembly protein TadD
MARQGTLQSGVWHGFIIGVCTLAVALVSCKPAAKKQVSSAHVESQSAQTPEQPAPSALARMQPVNVVLITLDTVRADHLHCYGDEKIKTPTIDGLARNGVLFEKAVAQTPLTEPSHASIFTGENPNVHHVRDTGGFALQPSTLTMAAILHRRGWDTAGFIGATVLKKQLGFNQGFATYDDRMPENPDHSAYLRAASRPANITVDHAIRWMNAQSGKPFFVWVHFYDAHKPYSPPTQFRRQYPNNPYDAAIAFEDEELGRFLEAVKKKSPGGKTLVLVLSDHGEGLGQHGEDDHGIFLYDSTVRIAWIMAGPGVPAGVRVEQQAREIDALPTVLDLLGAKGLSTMQGTSMVLAFSGKTVSTTYSYEETLYPKINMGWSELRGVHTAHWMYIRAPRPELYDLDQDPGELNNVIASHPKEFRELEAQLKQLSQMGNNTTETVATKPMDQETLSQLRSLGYVGGDSNVELNGKGADPKDMLPVLRILNSVVGPDSEKLPPARKIQLLQQALKLDPTDPALYYSLGEQYKVAGQPDQAAQTYVAALHHGIENGMILTPLGDLYLHSGHLKEATECFAEAMRLEPDNVERPSNLANAYLQDGRIADAEREFLAALKIQPYAPAYNGLAIIAEKRNDLATARKNFDHAMQLDPDYLEVQYNLGFLCMQMHDLPCMRAALKNFLKKAPPTYKNVIPQVESALAGMH